MFENAKQLKALAGMLGNLSGLKEKFEQMQAELERKTAEGSAGGGAVRATVNGKMKLVGLHLDTAMLTAAAGGGEAQAAASRERLEAMIVDAVDDAQQKAVAMAGEAFRGGGGGDGDDDGPDLEQLAKLLGN